MKTTMEQRYANETAIMFIPESAFSGIMIFAPLPEDAEKNNCDVVAAYYYDGKISNVHIHKIYNTTNCTSIYDRRYIRKNGHRCYID